MNLRHHQVMNKQFYTIEKLSKNQSLTNEGYLLCEGVPIARVGKMVYGAEELLNEDGSPAITPNDDGLIEIFREHDDVFRPETIASFNGKSVTDDHPQTGVVEPGTWQSLTVGTILNPRQGFGIQNDLLLADLLITVPSAIEAVRTGKREVSCGYEADYEELETGKGKQTNIIGNHVALVEAGRCGWRCAIGDQKLSTKEKQTMKKPSWLDRAKAAFKTKDEEAFVEAVEEGAQAANTGDDEGGDTHIHVHTNGAATDPAVMDELDPETVKPTNDEALEEHVAQNAAEHQQFRDDIEAIKEKLGMNEASSNDEEAIEGQLEAEAPIGTGDKARVANDSSYLGDSFASTVAAAEIVSPGIKLPTYDRMANPKKTFKDICNLRRTALDAAYAQPQTKEMITSILGNKGLDVKNMTCDAIRTVFNSVAVMKRSANNDSYRASGSSAASAAKQAFTLKDMNKAADAKWLK